jgi:hypothetical protein
MCPIVDGYSVMGAWNLEMNVKIGPIELKCKKKKQWTSVIPNKFKL